MSFSFGFTARSRKQALAMMEVQTNVPDAVRAFVVTAIENIPDPPPEIQRIVIVNAHGHLCAGKSWSPHSNATIEVKPLDFPID